MPPGAIFPYATTNPASSNDNLIANGILSTVLTTGAPVCVIKYKVKLTALGGPIVNTATAQVAGTNPATPITATAAVTFYANGLLPLTFLDFEAIKLKNKVSLKWETTNEINNNRFEIEASTDNNIYRKIGTVLPDTANTTNHFYLFDDANPSIGNNFYRIKQIDNNGRFSYSVIKKIFFDKKESTVVQIFPNPTKAAFINVQIAGTYNFIQIKIYNTLGQEIQIVPIVNSNGNFKLDISNLTKGIYFVQTIADNKKLNTEKLVVE